MKEKENKYLHLVTAVQDLLEELRIDRKELEAMADGYSPDYPGVPSLHLDNKHHCKVQISAVVAKELIETM